MKMRKVLAFGLASSIVLSLAACTSSETQSMVQAIDENKPIEISVEQMTPEKLSGSNLTELTWIPIGQLKTYNMGFRQAFDSIFNINITMESSSDTEGSKQGCLYVVNEDGRDIHSGNTTLYDAFRNKVFIEDYWNSASKKMELAELCEEIYTDIDRNSNYAVNAALNAYYNLTQDGENPGSYNATDILSREEFYTMLLKATTPVYEITDGQDFESKMGAGTEYTKYASQIAQYGWLQADNNSLDSYTISEPITVVEVIYTLVQMFFPDEYAAMTDESPNYSDIPTGGDLALKVGFKEEVKQDSGEKTVVEKDRWQSYILAYMLQNKDKGFQSELYRAMAVSKQMGIIVGNTSMWDKTVNKNDALVLIENTFLALNKTQGYLTTSEYAEIVHNDDDDDEDDNNSSSVIDIDDIFGNNDTEGTTDEENSTSEGIESTNEEDNVEETESQEEATTESESESEGAADNTETVTEDTDEASETPEGTSDTTVDTPENTEENTADNQSGNENT